MGGGTKLRLNKPFCVSCHGLSSVWPEQKEKGKTDFPAADL